MKIKWKWHKNSITGETGLVTLGEFCSPSNFGDLLFFCSTTYSFQIFQPEITQQLTYNFGSLSIEPQKKENLQGKKMVFLNCIYQRFQLYGEKLPYFNDSIIFKIQHKDRARTFYRFSIALTKTNQQVQWFQGNFQTFFK